MPAPINNTWQQRLKSWWHTDCEYCRKLRLVLIWGVLMYLILEWMYW